MIKCSIIYIIYASEQLKAFTKSQIPIKLCTLTKYNTKLFYNGFSVFFGRNAVDKYLA